MADIHKNLISVLIFRALNQDVWFKIRNKAILSMRLLSKKFDNFESFASNFFWFKASESKAPNQSSGINDCTDTKRPVFVERSSFWHFHDENHPLKMVISDFPFKFHLISSAMTDAQSGIAISRADFGSSLAMCRRSCESTVVSGVLIAGRIKKQCTGTRFGEPLVVAQVIGCL